MKDTGLTKIHSYALLKATFPFDKQPHQKNIPTSSSVAIKIKWVTINKNLIKTCFLFVNNSHYFESGKKKNERRIFASFCYSNETSRGLNKMCRIRKIFQQSSVFYLH